MSGAILAPMAGVTDLPFRLLCAEMGSAFCVTEMVSAKGLICSPENTRAIRSLLAVSPQEGPVSVQLFGHEPDIIAEAIRMLSGYPFLAIDLNFGCPTPKITGNGDGSALLRNFPLARQIIASARRATNLPLTVKMRLGWDERENIAVPFARMAEAEGVDALTVHGRTRSQFYSGEADWAAIADVQASVSIPVIGNGDIFSAEDAMARIRQSGCDSVMIGRGALGNPWIFSQVQALLHQKQAVLTLPTNEERVAMAMRHARMLCAWKGEAAAIREMRRHAAWYVRGVAGATKLRGQIHQARTLDELEGALCDGLHSHRTILVGSV